MSNKKKPTYYELARKAGVSPATVSRIISGKSRVDSKIRSTVQRIADEMGISLEKNAKPSKMMAFVLANRGLAHSFQARVLIGAQNYASSQGWELVFVTHRYPENLSASQIQLPQILAPDSPIRGVILSGINTTNFIEAIENRSIPFSILGNGILDKWEDMKRDVVCTDDVGGASEMVRYLISCGHRDIWFIGNTRYPWFARGFMGYQAAMKEARFEARSCEIRSDGRELGYLGAKSILSSGKPVTAIFAGTDQVALGVYEALDEASFSIPDDISVVGFNDTGATNLRPNLTSVREFPEELGRHLVEFALNRIMDANLPPQRIMIPAQLVLRNSIKPISRSMTSDG